ncbi:DNA mismatch repair protein MutS [Mesotoga sp. BH458_6_3_2_1]|uniref:DNA mismatch repair protein MutS n=1 Tax=Mesotoga sp. BH458_6_3_2_1 TaxID=1437446 RepID=UPI000EF27E2B|nr:DNA mismatch repair protein MutS [Mesotoga sp. BH458_6_3_2_1]
MTPMMKQYLEVKNSYKDCLVLFRLGDFYETFLDDAKLVSKELQIVLTSRNGVPMAGVPYHSINGYLKKLVTAGYKVAICEQTEDPAFAKGLVKREVTRVVTPGTIVEDELLPESENNYIIAVGEADELFIMATADVSTGEVALSAADDLESMKDFIAATGPSQILLRESLKALKREISEITFAMIEIVEDWHFALSSGINYVKEFYSIASIDHLELNNKEIEVLGALFKYLETINFGPMKHLSLPRVIRKSDSMQLDASTIENLNLFRLERKGSLFEILDETITGMGRRRLRQWLLSPLTDREKIEERLDAVQTFYSDRHLLDELREYFENVFDIERITTRLSTDKTTPRDLQSLRTSLAALPLIKELISTEASFERLNDRLELFPEELALLQRSIMDEPSAAVGDGKVIREGFDHELDSLRDLLEHSVEKMKAIEAAEKKSTGISSLKVKFNKVFGYFLEVPKSQTDKVPQNYTRKQTLVNSERYITEELKEFEDKILSANDKIQILERALFLDVCSRLLNSLQRLKAVSKVLSEIDSLQSLAAVARKNNYSRPRFSNDGKVKISNSRHPIVERFVSDFTPNDVSLSRSENFFIVTGPNMSGKSTFIRQVALLSIMAQVGSFVPADEALLSIHDRVFTRIGARDELASGKSTFLVEMMETATILSKATEDSLVILDEVGRGTSTFDGISIAWAVSEFIYEAVGCHTIFATHFTELTELSNMYPGIKNKTVRIIETDSGIVFLHKVIDGVANSSHGIEVAKLAGVPETVLSRAKEILKVISKQSALDKAVRVLTADDLKEIRQSKKGKMNRNQITLF